MSLTDRNHEQYFNLLTDDKADYFSNYTADEAGHNDLDFRRGLTAGTDVFLYDVSDYESGNCSAIDTAIKFKAEIERLEEQINMRKQWLDENKSAVADDSEKYPEGYKGLKFSIQTRTTYDFSKVADVIKLKASIKELEEKGKLALKLIEKGVEPIDGATGEILPIPEVKITSFLKTDKVK